MTAVVIGFQAIAAALGRACTVRAQTGLMQKRATNSAALRGRGPVWPSQRYTTLGASARYSRTWIFVPEKIRPSTSLAINWSGLPESHISSLDNRRKAQTNLAFSSSERPIHRPSSCMSLGRSWADNKDYVDLQSAQMFYFNELANNEAYF